MTIYKMLYIKFNSYLFFHVFLIFSFQLFFLLQEIYREIVSQARTVGACIRASEAAARKKSVDIGQSSDKDHSSLEVQSDHISAQTSSGGQKSGSGGEAPLLKGLERRYHLLYLKAIEIQCLLEGLLSRKNSPVSVWLLNFQFF